MSGANIKISENNDSVDSRRMSISGPPEAVRTAHQLIAARYEIIYDIFVHQPGLAQYKQLTLHPQAIRLIVAAQKRILILALFYPEGSQNGNFFLDRRINKTKNGFLLPKT